MKSRFIFAVDDKTSPELIDFIRTIDENHYKSPYSKKTSANWTTYLASNISEFVYEENGSPVINLPGLDLIIVDRVDDTNIT
jgi:hypothetical protein